MGDINKVTQAFAFHGFLCCEDGREIMRESIQPQGVEAKVQMNTYIARSIIQLFCKP